MHTVQIINNNHPEIKIAVNWCDSFLPKLKGLMFVSSLPDNTGLIFVENSESRINTSIHMMFMNFDITTVWVNSQYQIVDVVLAKKWHLAYVPKTPAKYTIEINAHHIDDFHVGDQLIFSNEK